MKIRAVVIGSVGMAFTFALAHCGSDSDAPAVSGTLDGSAAESSTTVPTPMPTPTPPPTGSDGGGDGGPAYDDAGCRVFSEALPDPGAAGIPSSGLVLWLRADRIAAKANGEVCRWEDLSGNGHDFAITTTPPTVSAAGLRGKPAVTFSGVDTALRRLDVLGIGAASARTVAAFGASADTSKRFNYFFQGDWTTNDDYWGLDMNTFNSTGSKEGVYVTGNAYDSNVATSTAPRSHVYAIDSFTPGGVILDLVHYDIDGVATTLTRTSGGTGNTQVEDFSGADRTEIGLGRADFGTAVLGELLVYDRALSAPERAAVNAYFQSRFPE